MRGAFLGARIVRIIEFGNLCSDPIHANYQYNPCIIPYIVASILFSFFFSFSSPFDSRFRDYPIALPKLRFKSVPEARQDLPRRGHSQGR